MKIGDRTFWTGLVFLLLSINSIAPEESTLSKSGEGWDDYLNPDGSHTLRLYPGTLRDENGTRKPFTELTNLTPKNQKLRLDWYSYESNGTKSLLLDPYIIFNKTHVDDIPPSRGFATSITKGKGHYKWSHGLLNNPHMESMGFKVITNETVTPVNTIETEVIPRVVVNETTGEIIEINETFMTGWKGLIVGEQMIIFNDLIENGYTVNISLPYIEIGNLTGKGDNLFLDPVITPTGDDIYINEDTHIDPSGSPYNINDSNNNGVLIINASNVLLDCNGALFFGLNKKGVGIYNDGFDNVSIKNCYIRSYFSGIRLDHSSNSILTKNYVGGNEYGIHLTSSSNYNELVSNNAYSNDNGIRLESSNHNTLTKNTVLGNSYGIYLTSSSYNTLTSNTVKHNNNVDIGLSYSSNNALTSNTASESVWGISLISSSNGNILINNNVSNNNYGGIFLRSGSSYNTLINNVVNNNYERGIVFFWRSNNNILINNSANNNKLGIHVHRSDYNNITQNTISSNIQGLWITTLTTYQCFCYEGFDNVIYHNNIVDNNISVGIGYDRPLCDCGNIWDNGYPSGGNYWSDYEEEDEGCYDNNADGICDNPYVIDVNDRDNYPFTIENGWISTCYNNIWDSNEEGVDCGGSCPPCLPNLVITADDITITRVG